MTREEQIRKYAEEKCVLYDNIGFDGDVYSLVVETIEWADKHPKKGLVSIDEACEWLNSVDMRMYVIADHTSSNINRFAMNKFISDFHKAMEE